MVQIDVGFGGTFAVDNLHSRVEGVGGRGWVKEVGGGGFVLN